MLVKKGIKINSQLGDTHQDNEKCIILAEITTPDDAPQDVKDLSDGLYTVIFDRTDIPIFTIREKIFITDEVLSEFIPNEYQKKYLDEIFSRLKDYEMPIRVYVRE